MEELSISTTGTYTVRLAACGKWWGLLQRSPHLTSLEIADAWLHGWPAAEPLLTSLKHLSLDRVLSEDYHTDSHIPGKHLSLLQQLTYLQLAMWPSVTAATMAELSSLSRLQELRLAHGGDWLECADDWTDGEAAVRLAAVRRSMACLQCLTSLHLQRLYPPPLPECLSQLPALEELSLHDCFCLQPNCLAGGDKLKSLTISRSVKIDNSPLLLQHLGRMTQLTSLNLHRSCAVYSIDAPPSVFAALTASSSSLQRLDLSSCLLDDGWPIVFRQAGRRRLTAVTNLKLQGAEPELSVSDIRKLSLACPNLHTLDLRDALQPKASLLVLTNLAGLTALEISRVTTESAVSSRFLAQLTF